MAVSMFGCNKNSYFTEERLTAYDTQAELTADESGNSFLLSEKTYNYKENKVLIINAENTSDNAYSIVLNVKFFDENGGNIKNKTKIFEGFPAGYSNYFVFSPEVPFDSYTYEFSASPYEKETYAEYLSFDKSVSHEYVTMRADLDGNVYETPRVTLMAEYSMNCNYNEDEPIVYSADFVLFDNKGEIFMIDTLKEGELSFSTEVHTTTRAYMFSEEDSKNFEKPDNLKGDLVGIVAFNSVTCR